ncbi:MAG: shikimate kinase, partial [Clostridium sp.]
MEKNKRIALIGMPGCGKSTVGEILAIKLNKKLIDLDDYIIKREEKSIDELFEIGEYFFREAETRALKKVATEENVILSTGGGIIKEKENSNILGKNFIVVF